MSDDLIQCLAPLRRQGRVAQSIRTLLRVAAIKRGTRAVLEIV